MKNPFLSSDDSVFVQKPGSMVRWKPPLRGCFLRAPLCPVSHMEQTSSRSPCVRGLKPPTVVRSAWRAAIWFLPRCHHHSPAHWLLCCHHINHPRFPALQLCVVCSLCPQPSAGSLLIRSLYKCGLFYLSQTPFPVLSSPLLVSLMWHSLVSSYA